MRNITLSAQEQLIQTARKKASAENTTLNNLFREWLAQYVFPKQEAKKQIDNFEESLRLVSFKTDRKYSRQEMNQR